MQYVSDRGMSLVKKCCGGKFGMTTLHDTIGWHLRENLDSSVEIKTASEKSTGHVNRWNQRN